MRENIGLIGVIFLILLVLFYFADFIDTSTSEKLYHNQIPYALDCSHANDLPAYSIFS